MPAKIATSASRPSFGLPELTVAVRTSLLSCGKAEKPRKSSPGWEPSGESRSNGRPQGRAASRGFVAVVQT
jgi:hypothetical protein